MTLDVARRGDRHGRGAVDDAARVAGGVAMVDRADLGLEVAHELRRQVHPTGGARNEQDLVGS